MGFFQQVGLAMGNNMLVGQQMDDTQATIDLKQQQVAAGKMSMLAQQKENDVSSRIGKFITDAQAADKSTITNPTATADLYTKASQIALQGGSWDKAQKLSTLAKGSLDQAKEANDVVEKKVHTAKETLANSAMDYITLPTPDGAAAIGRNAVAAGIDPLTIPPPATPEFKSWVQNQSQVALASKDRLAAVEKTREFDVQEASRAESEEARAEDARASRQSLALYRDGLLDAKRDSTAATKSRVQETREFNQTHTLNKDLTKEAAPLLADRTILTQVKNLLAVDSPMSDQQIRQALPSLLGGLKARSTTQFYRDNKYYGNIVDKLNEFASRSITGRMSEETRQGLFTMLDQMEKLQIDPALTKLEENAKRQAGKFNLDPDKVELGGVFNRLDYLGNPAKPKEPAPSAAMPVPETPATAASRAQGDVSALQREIARIKPTNAAARGQLEVLNAELRKAKVAAAGAQPTAAVAPAPAPAPARAAPAAPTKSVVMDGKTFNMIGGQWLQQ